MLVHTFDMAKSKELEARTDSSTFQLILSRFRHKIRPGPPLMSPTNPQNPS